MSIYENEADAIRWSIGEYLEGRADLDTLRRHAGGCDWCDVRTGRITPACRVWRAIEDFATSDPESLRTKLEEIQRGDR